MAKAFGKIFEGKTSIYSLFLWTNGWRMEIALIFGTNQGHHRVFFKRGGVLVKIRWCFKKNAVVFQFYGFRFLSEKSV